MFKDKKNFILFLNLILRQTYQSEQNRFKFFLLVVLFLKRYLNVSLVENGDEPCHRKWERSMIMLFNNLGFISTMHLLCQTMMT